MLLPLLRECYGDDTVRILDDLQRLHLLIAAILQKLVEQYETRSKALVRSQQEQLRAYSQQLEAHLIQVGEEFQTLQDFNESILQSMTSGLLVADKDTHRILKVNRALERLSGLPATAVVGKTVEEVFAGWSGLPLSEFAEEVERHGSITLRKHRLRTASGREHYRSIHGEVFYNQRGENRGVLVLVDDISETEILRDTFSRFLSQHVMEQMLSDVDLRSLRSARRDVTVLFADIRNFTAFAEQHPSEQVVDVLNAYFDVMVQVLFEYQGTLDKFLGDGLLALFGTPLAAAGSSTAGRASGPGYSTCCSPSQRCAPASWSTHPAYWHWHQQRRSHRRQHWFREAYGIYGHRRYGKRRPAPPGRWHVVGRSSLGPAPCPTSSPL